MDHFPIYEMASSQRQPKVALEFHLGHAPFLAFEGVQGPLGYQVPAALLGRGLHLPAVDHLPYATVAHAQDTGGQAVD
jgi:hypothetical protein